MAYDGNAHIAFVRKVPDSIQPFTKVNSLTSKSSFTVWSNTKCWSVCMGKILSTLTVLQNVYKSKLYVSIWCSVNLVDACKINISVFGNVKSRSRRVWLFPDLHTYTCIFRWLEVFPVYLTRLENSLQIWQNYCQVFPGESKPKISKAAWSMKIKSC